MKKTPYQKISDAYQDNKGVKLSAKDVRLLMMDDAIAMVAALDDEKMGLTQEESDHYECFVPLSSGPFANNDCNGDGWHGCKDCGKYKQKRSGTFQGE